MTLARRWSDASLAVKGLIVVAIPVVAFSLAVGGFVFAGRIESRAQAEVARSLEIQSEISTLTRLIVDAETGVRGYLLTKDRSFLEPYETSVDQIDSSLDELEELEATQSDQLLRIRRMEALIGKRAALLRKHISLQEAGGIPSERRERMLRRGKELQDRLRSILGEMSARQDALLAQYRDEVEQGRGIATASIIGGVLVGLLGGILGVLLFTRGVTARARIIEENARRMVGVLPLLDVPPAHDEIGRLGANIAGTAARLADREKDLREARAFLEEVIERSPVIIFRRDPEGVVLSFVSTNVRRILGYDPREMVGVEDFWLERVHPEDRRALAEQTSASVERRAELIPASVYRFRKADGNYAWLETVGRVEFEGGVPTAVLGYALDVTERQAAEHALADREATMSAIYETSPDVIAIVDGLGNRRYVSPSVRHMLGYEPADLLGEQPSTVHPDDARLRAELMHRAFKSDRPVTARYRMGHAEGRWVWVDVRATRFEAPGSDQPEVMLSIREVTSQVQLEGELRRAKEEAESANRAKSEFLSRMSHELRTPLNAILGFAQILQMQNLNPGQGDSVDEILRGGRHLLDLINEVLDIARIETGKLSLSLEPVAIEPLVRESLGLVRPLAAQRTIELESPRQMDPSWHAMADRQRLKQVLLNLLSNAVKYNRPRGRVSLQCEVTSDARVRISVTDTGPGISDEKMALLFSPFERLGAEQTTVEGTGLGLALSKRLAETMGGTIEVKSAVGAGSRFTIDLASVEGPVERARRLAVEPEASLDGSRRTLVYVEDNLSNLKLVEYILARRPEVTLHAAMQGRIGLDIIRQHLPDLVLLDLDLPDIPGMQVLRLLQDDPETRAIPVVVISADATPGQVDRLLRAGAVGYLTKPLDVHRFLSVIDSSLSESESA